MIDRDTYDFDDAQLDYDPITERYHLSFDPAQRARPSMMVVQLISYITEEPPLSLPELQAAVETDSLDNGMSTPREQKFEVTFRYAGYRITLNQGGEIWAESTDDIPDAADSNS